MTQTVPEWKTTADEIWAILKETARRQEDFVRWKEEVQQILAETDQILKGAARHQEESRRHQEETDRLIKENERLMKEYNKRFGDFTNRFGQVVEHMVMPNLLTKFNELNFNFTKATRSIKVNGYPFFAEIDALLENDQTVMAVEIKTKPAIGDINDHIKRMEKLRSYAASHNDKRSYLGAIAGVVFNESEKHYALKTGFYVVEPSGETFIITAPKDNYQPRTRQP
jgi:hypothetical protein